MVMTAYHRLCAIHNPQNDSEAKFLIAATGATLQTFNIGTGTALSDAPASTWTAHRLGDTKVRHRIQAPCDRGHKVDHVQQNENDASEDDDAPPTAKKQKSGPRAQHADFRVILLQPSIDYTHVVCVTDPDKCIRVLEIDAQSGGLTESSQRCVVQFRRNGRVQILTR